MEVNSIQYRPNEMIQDVQQAKLNYTEKVMNTLKQKLGVVSKRLQGHAISKLQEKFTIDKFKRTKPAT